MKIRDVRVIGLVGGTVDGGWPQGNKPEEDLNTLVEVHTDEGLVGLGSSMTSRSLVAAAVDLLRPHLIGERGWNARDFADAVADSLARDLLV